MFKGIANFFISRMSLPIVVDLIKAQIPKLTDQQKQELVTLATQLAQAAAAGAVQGAMQSK